MLARVRARLTYANVVATLALFVALGGTGYAASQITSRDVKNRSLKGADVKKNTLTGTEVNESKLRQVPNARAAESSAVALQAANANVSDLAKNADRATTAGTAGTAGLADVASDARALAGQGAGFFEKSSRTDFGLAPIPTAPPQEKAVIAWPAPGAEVRTITGVCAGSAMQMQVTNTRSTGGGSVTVFEGNTAVPVAPGNTQNVCSHANDTTGADLAHLTFQVGDAGPNGRAWFVQCVKVFSTAQEERCIGVRSEP
jgi:flagellar hook-basal body complex protein FliE